MRVPAIGLHRSSPSAREFTPATNFISFAVTLIDAHIHVWDLQRLSYPWLAGAPGINRTYLLSDYDAARGNRAVEAMVFVQCECEPAQHLEELRWVQPLADADPRLQGIVPWAPLETGDAVEAELAEMAKDLRVKGVRRIIQFEADPDFCLNPKFIRGVHLLGEHGLHFEITIAPHHFPRVMKVIAACPETRFILDHIGNPDISAGRSALEPWRKYLREFAASEPHPWGSDWPHALRASQYLRWLETAEALTAHLSAADRRKIFHDNAASYYRLNIR